MVYKTRSRELIGEVEVALNALSKIPALCILRSELSALAFQEPTRNEECFGEVLCATLSSGRSGGWENMVPI